jgi:alpha-galactosidase
VTISVAGQVFCCDTLASSYWFRVTDQGHLEHLYYGPRLGCASRNSDATPPGRLSPDSTPSTSAPSDIETTAQALAWKRTAQIGSTVAYSQSDLTYSLDVLPLEWSGMGYGDYRYSPIEALMPDGAFASDFTYEGHSITQGALPIDGLPSAYIDSPADAATLTVTLRDESGLRLDLIYTVFEQVNAITRRAVVVNETDDAVTLHRLLSGMIDLPGRDFVMSTFDGGWIKETHRHDRPVSPGMTVNSSTTGASSNRHNPGFLLAESTARQNSGWVYGFNLVYSGNHLGVVEGANHGLVRVALGINDHCFAWRLSPGERFDSPEMVLTFSDAGYNGVSHNFHDFVSQHIVRGQWKHKPRPVLLNNWEAHFFDFTERKLLDLARGARDLGVELFVLDDGWFGQRNNDTASLGDYTVNRKKLPSGLRGFGEKLNDMGLDFGLWFEPEMVNEDSDLYRNHPEWAVRIPGRRNTQGRNQYVLDLTNPDVQDYIIDSVGDVLDSAPITYVKWDMNRHLSDAWSPTCPAGEFYHRYMLGLYRVLEEIFDARPHILLESCSSGGNRFDLGILCYSPQVWASDDTDPVERLAIQGGLSYLYPPSTMGAHVSASPHQQTLRATPLSTRFNVAAFGMLGYELDLRYLTRLERQEIAQQIEYYKAHRETLQYGRFSRVDNPKANKIQWQVVARDGSEAVAGFFQTLAQASESNDQLRVEGLDPSQTYTVDTRPQYLYLKRFGELLKHILPIELHPDGAILRTAGKFYKMTDCVEHYVADGAALAAGIGLNNQFVGSHYNPDTRLLGDFGSTLYSIKAVDHE